MHAMGKCFTDGLTNSICFDSWRLRKLQMSWSDKRAQGKWTRMATYWNEPVVVPVESVGRRLVARDFPPRGQLHAELFVRPNEDIAPITSSRHLSPTQILSHWIARCQTQNWPFHLPETQNPLCWTFLSLQIAHSRRSVSARWKFCRCSKIWCDLRLFRYFSMKI